MLSRRAILSIQYTAAGPKAGKAVGGFLRYVHYRDHHNLGERDRGVGGLVRYVAYRDSAAPEGRLFDASKTVGDRERRELIRYVRRSLTGIPDFDPAGNRRPARAVYRFVLSPEDARGLDLRRLTRTTMGPARARHRRTAALDRGRASQHRASARPHRAGGTPPDEQRWLPRSAGDQAAASPHERGAQPGDRSAARRAAAGAVAGRPAVGDQSRSPRAWAPQAAVTGVPLAARAPRPAPETVIVPSTAASPGAAPATSLRPDGPALPKGS